MKDRVNFLIELSRTTQEELMFRIRLRDRWLVTQLISLAVLIGLSCGLELWGFKKPVPPVAAGATAGAQISQAAAIDPTPPSLLVSDPVLLLLAAPIVACILAIFYTVEDQLIGDISQWRRCLAAEEAKIHSSSSAPAFAMWESSEQLKTYGNSTLIFRVIGQFVAFVVLPFFAMAICCGQRTNEIWQAGPLTWGPLAACIGFCVAATVWVLGAGYRRRKAAYRQLGTTTAEPAPGESS